MKLETCFKLFLGIFLVIFLLNVVFADDGPVIDKNQAQAIAQDYLNTNGYSSYKAVATDNLIAKVKEISTGNIKWMDAGQAKMESREGNEIQLILPFVRVVDIIDKNGQSVGKIYVDSYRNPGEIVYKELPGDSSSDSDSGSNSETDNTGEDLSYNGTGNNDESSEGIIGTLQDLLNGLMSLFQQLWTSIFGG